ncbi:hypothetical protein [Microbulbifer rhizosphaerae]|uniref:Uncharacterized protein n=1 Tax=Microbulbifer rhizosphaerae TaxID=1562603 RepID=A0A7W4Z9W1_9GAMM|nr:hypothetical protein [Microbulbifer rhizosphaerae]MBB3060610.1 hypothetical protein [Microbulbifer rhizosphaerae]
MIIFSVTRKGFKELEPIIKSGKYPVWIGGNVLSEEEVEAVRDENVSLTNFSYQIYPTDKEALEEALCTIAEHHPKERVWCECQPKI